MGNGKRLVAEVTMPHGKKTTIDVTTDKKNYGFDLAKLKEIYGDSNVKEKR